MKKLPTLIKNTFTDKAFISLVIAVAVPIMIQNTITNFVNMLDNLMVGQLGTEQMSSVAIVNQLIFVYNLCVFGGLSGAGIYTAQFFGCGEQEGIRNTFRYKLIAAAGLTAAAMLMFVFCGDSLVGLYLKGEADGSDPAAVLESARSYLRFLLPGLPAFMLTQVYATTLKECGETVAPMRASVTAVAVNLVFNYMLIYGHFGFPQLGVVGAAIATSLSRYAELGIILLWIKRHPEKTDYLKGVYSSLHIPAEDTKKYTVKGLPLLANEFLWSSGMAVLNGVYSLRGLTVVAALNISTTLCNVFQVVFLSLGISVTIIVGQLLGAGELEKAKDTDTKLAIFAVLTGLTVGLCAILCSPFFPKLYNVTEPVRRLAQSFIIVNGMFMVQHAFSQQVYFTLRTGGKSFLTFCFDSGFTWAVMIPVAFAAAKLTSLGAVYILFLVNASEFIKTFFGFKLLRSNIWLVSMTGKA